MRTGVLLVAAAIFASTPVAGAFSQSFRTIGDLIREGYEIKAVLPGIMFLQKGTSAYMCEFTMPAGIDARQARDFSDTMCHVI